MTRIFNAFQSIKAWAVNHSNNFMAGVFAPILGYFSPIKNMFFVAFAVIAVDFITGVIAARVQGIGIKSAKLYKSLYKIGCIWAILGLTYAIDTEIPVFQIHTIIAWIIVGFELWSILENMGKITDHPIFRILRKFMKDKIEDVSGVDISEQENESMSRKDNK